MKLVTAAEVVQYCNYYYMGKERKKGNGEKRGKKDK